MVFLLILGFLAIIVIDAPVLIIRGEKRELRAFWGVLLLSFIFSLAVALHWPVPNPTFFLEALFRPLTSMMSGGK